MYFYKISHERWEVEKTVIWHQKWKKGTKRKGVLVTRLKRRRQTKAKQSIQKGLQV